MIEVLMQVRKDKYKDNPILPEGLDDLVEEEEQVTHEIQLEDSKVEEGLTPSPIRCTSIRCIDLRDISNATQITWKPRKSTRGSRLTSSARGPTMNQGQRRAIVSTTTTKVGLDYSYLSPPVKYLPAVPEKEGIQDHTETNLVNLRRVIYLTIMNALNYEEAV
jgi:pre-mRNA-splicing factor CWC22